MVTVDSETTVGQIVVKNSVEEHKDTSSKNEVDKVMINNFEETEEGEILHNDDLVIDEINAIFENEKKEEKVQAKSVVPDPDVLEALDLTIATEFAQEAETLNKNNNNNNNNDDDVSKSENTFRFNVDNFSWIVDFKSDIFMLRNLPWTVLIQQKLNENGEKRLGYFLQCNEESVSSWSCYTIAELKIINQRGRRDKSMKLFHQFSNIENDWGYPDYCSWNVLQDPKSGYIKDDSVTFEVHVSADPPRGLLWDSKKHTGYVGLKNQGATCYMNSLLQVLYFTNAFRKIVYKLPTENDDSRKSVALALQGVFRDLQFLDKPVGTKRLTESFGWTSADSFMQHDVQEFLRVLLDKLESKMKRTSLEGTIPRLFQGKMVSYIKCKNVEYSSTRTETFYDIQLNIKGKKSIEESFADYIRTETLEGENKYDAGNFGLQDAEKGILFEHFPPVLHLHLMRFVYDPVIDTSAKFNDRCEFPEVLDLSSYLQSDPDTQNKTDSYKYVLHAVLVHSGDNHAGHYVVYINPKGDGSWCKFDDDVVSSCSKEKAIQLNFGDDSEEVDTSHGASAYMLVYIQQTHLDEVLAPVGSQDIPDAMYDRLNKEKIMKVKLLKEKNEAHLFMSVRMILEDSFHGHQGNDLFNQDTVLPFEFKIRKSLKLGEFLKTIGQNMMWSVDRLRLWSFSYRKNNTLRPNFVNMENLSISVAEASENTNIWTVFLEILDPETETADNDNPQTKFDKKLDVLLFFKYYCPRTSKIHYMTHMCLSIHTILDDLLPKLRKLANLPPETKLMLWEEVKPNLMDRIDEHTDRPLEHLFDELLDGDIIVFQETPQPDDNFELPTAKDYYSDLFYKVEVVFCDANATNEPGFCLQMNVKMTYDQFARKVAAYLGTDHYHLQFFKCQSYQDGPGNPIRCNYEGLLKDLLVDNSFRQENKIYYQRINIPINELENKIHLQLSWAGRKGEKELLLYPDRDAKVKELLEEAKTNTSLDLEEEGGTGKLRILEIMGCMVFSIVREEASVDRVKTTAIKNYRLEEIPRDHLDLGEGDILVPVAHFNKEVYNTFGSPFLVVVKQGDTVGTIKERMQNSLGLTQGEWEKYKVALVIHSQAEYLEEDDRVIDPKEIPEFEIQSLEPLEAGRSWIGLDHSNTAKKRSRHNNRERGVTIYN